MLKYLEIRKSYTIPGLIVSFSNAVIEQQLLQIFVVLFVTKIPYIHQTNCKFVPFHILARLSSIDAARVRTMLHFFLLTVLTGTVLAVPPCKYLISRLEKKKIFNKYLLFRKYLVKNILEKFKLNVPTFTNITAP